MSADDNLPATKFQKTERLECPHVNDKPFRWCSVTGRFVYCVECLRTRSRKYGQMTSWKIDSRFHYTSKPDENEGQYIITLPICDNACIIYESCWSDYHQRYLCNVNWADLASCAIPAHGLPTEPDADASEHHTKMQIEVCRVIERIIHDKRFFWFPLLVDIIENNCPGKPAEYSPANESVRLGYIKNFVENMITPWITGDGVFSWMTSFLAACTSRIQYKQPVSWDIREYKERREKEFARARDSPFAARFPFVKDIAFDSPPYKSNLWPVWLGARNTHRRLLLLCLIRKHCAHSPFHDDNLPRDMFKLIVAAAGLFFFPDAVKGELFYKDGTLEDVK